MKRLLLIWMNFYNKKTTCIAFAGHFTGGLNKIKNGGIKESN